MRGRLGWNEMRIVLIVPTLEIDGMKRMLRFWRTGADLQSVIAWAHR